MNKMEIFAGEKAYQLDEFKNRQMKTFDFSSGEENANRYILIINEGETKRIILEPNEEMVKMIKGQFPRKVF